MPDDPIYLFNHLSFLGAIIQPLTLGIVIALICMLAILIMSALVSAAESAFFALTPQDTEVLNNSKNKIDAKILKLTSAPKRLLATLLISVNFLNIGFVIISSTFIFGNNGWFDFSTNPGLGFTVQVIVVTFLIIFIAEITPKIYATQNPLKVTRSMAVIVQGLRFTFYPISTMLIGSTFLFDKFIKPKNHSISVDDLSHALDITNNENITDENQKILEGIVKFGNTDVKQIMQSRIDITAFDSTLKYTELLTNMTDCGLSRVPIYNENLDTIAGVLYAKDLLSHLDKKDDFEWLSLIRAPFYVPENKKIDDLLREFQQKKIHLAIIVDEYGGTSGIATLEDVIEEIIGEINDEFDDDKLIYSKLDDHNYVFEGKAHLNDVCRIINIEQDYFTTVKGDAETLAGLVIEMEGRILTKGETVSFEKLLFTIISADNRKIKRVKITIQDS